MHCGIAEIISLPISALEMKIGGNLSPLKVREIIEAILPIILTKQRKGVTSLPSIPRVILFTTSVMSLVA